MPTLRPTTYKKAPPHFEAMTRYYEYMGWGEYITNAPNQDKKLTESWFGNRGLDETEHYSKVCMLGL